MTKRPMFESALLPMPDQVFPSRLCKRLHHQREKPNDHFVERPYCYPCNQMTEIEGVNARNRGRAALVNHALEEEIEINVGLVHQPATHIPLQEGKYQVALLVA